MNTISHSITVNNIEVQIVRKDIKNLHLAVYPPDGRVRVAVPNHVTDENVRLAVIEKLNWIKKQQAHFETQSRQSEREMVSGETHYVWGKRYRIEVIERWGKHEINFKNNVWLRLLVSPNTSRTNRERVMNEWHRAKIKQRIPDLIEKWEPIIGVQVQDWGVKKMKTKWGSCNINAERVWLNLELAKKPAECLEYILVHEMVHLLERLHNDVFRAHMNKFMPLWSFHRSVLNQSPLAHENWHY
ncbi:MAG: SprT family zinc-dependent metalloprotease [Anaerolineae bacterium]|nr:SprT family zinc-dependent metalloprotease [Anaerolineae bacterium]